MKFKYALLASLISTSAGALAADSGTVTMTANVYTSACTLTTADATLTIPDSKTSDYVKGATSTTSNLGAVEFTCPVGGVTLSVEGTPDSTDPTLFEVTPGTGRATGVALKITAQNTTGAGAGTEYVMEPNIENSNVFASADGTSATAFNLAFHAQAVAVEDTVLGGDLSTTLTWTAHYN